MSKKPWFPFYPDNFEGGADAFTLEQDGAYLRLLILQFRTGSFTEEQALDKLSMRCRGNAMAYAALWNFLKPKFTPENFDGVNYYNDRMALEMEKSKKTSERQSVTALKRWGKVAKPTENCDATGDAMAYATGDAFNFSNKYIRKEKKEVTRVKEKRTNVKRADFSILNQMVPEGWPVDRFIQVFTEFWEMRITKNKPLTENAIRRRIKQLIEVSGGNFDLAEKIAQRATDALWDEFYPLHESQKQKSYGKLVRDQA